MEVPVELSRIVISELGDQQVIFLKEKEGQQRSFPIVIGIHEALAIDRRLKGIKTPRPMTHDLIDNILEGLSVAIERIVVSDLEYSSYDGGGTFIGVIHLVQDGRKFQIDSRPSDAIALGAAHDVPLFVDEKVLDRVTSSPATLEERLDLLRRRLDILGKRISQYTQLLDNQDFLDQAPEEVIQEHRRQLTEMSREYEAIDQILKKLG